MTATHPLPRQKGFTIVEMAIVLVIAGLIFGGIVLGLDLIKSAEIRATISQVEKYNSAVNTFRSKYNGLPGDISQSAAAGFGLFTLATPSIAGNGDDNGLIEGGATGSVLPQGETLVFWRHLAHSRIIDGGFGTVGNSIIIPATGLVSATVTNIKQSIPPSRINISNSFIVYAFGGANYYQIMPIASITPAPSYTFGTSGITPMQAYHIDTKLDDGLANSGNIIARGIGAINALPSWGATPAAGLCTTAGSDATDPVGSYNVDLATGGNNPVCSISFHFN